MSLTPGARLGAFEIVEPLGAGGMGEVYRARDTKLHRDVAIKVLSSTLTGDAERLARFGREARLLAALNHSNIASIYALEEPAIVMELVEGETLAQVLARAPDGLPLPQAVDIARQLAAGLAAAHGKGIVHRDLKPANVMITPAGVAKILDFGLAKIDATPHDATATFEGTWQGVILGTAAYMSPEQAQGNPVDSRSDVFSLGAVVYEMLTGRAPFRGSTLVETLAKVLEARPPDARRLRAEIPAALATLVEQCLDKERDRRPQASDVHAALSGFAQSSEGAPTPASVRRQRAVFAAMLIAAVAAVAGWAWWWWSGRDIRLARQRVPALLEAASRFDYDAFYRGAHDVVPMLPDDLQIKQVWLNMTFALPIQTDPPGADVWVKGYSAVNADWIPVGRTPLEQTRLPFGAVRIRVEKPGYVRHEGAFNGQTIVLAPDGSAPQGMVRVAGAQIGIHGAAFQVPDFWMDRFEVTNKDFKQFVDAGGYHTREYWKEPIVDNGRTLEWAEAMARFRDRTGLPGPSTWQVGTYPEGQADVAVAGVSWYEAAAYAAFAGKSLPTAYQWRAAASGVAGVGGIFSDILLFSNFGMKGPAAVGSHPGIGTYGTYDMAGNVKEWCWNPSRGGRMILGGGWNESSYKYLDLDAQPAIERGPAFGLRLVRNIQPAPDGSYTEIRRQLTRDYSRETPVDDATFAIYRELYAYDPRPLNARTESAEDTAAWRRELVTIDGAYGERIPVYLFLPKAATPPYQAVIFFPGGDAPFLPSSRDLRLTTVDFIARTGRALVYPVYKGTFERRVQLTGARGGRDLTIAAVKDFSRVVDFLQERPDIDRERLAFYGDSRGAFHGVIVTAIEPRLKASVLLGGGLPGSVVPPEIDLLNFAPRIRVPTLMVSGRSDFLVPVETAQIPLFQRLGSSPEHKRHRLFDGGHAPGQLPDVIREILGWLDQYLGPVKPARAQ